MNNHIITITEIDNDLIADKSEIEACPGDTVELVNHARVAIALKFCEVDSNGRTIECPAEHGPLAAGRSHPGLVMPNTTRGTLINSIDIFEGNRWPKITVKRGNCTGG